MNTMQIVIKHTDITMDQLKQALSGGFEKFATETADTLVIERDNSEIKLILTPQYLEVTVCEYIDNSDLVLLADRLEWFGMHDLPSSLQDQIGKIGNLCIARNRLELAIAASGGDNSLDDTSHIELPALVYWDSEYRKWTYACIADVQALVL